MWTFLALSTVAIWITYWHRVRERLADFGWWFIGMALDESGPADS